MSQTTSRPIPCASRMLVHAIPAAPAPVTTTRTSSGRLPTTRSALSSAARTTIAVPCWSSWKTGMSSSSRRRRSISKQRGAAMSSRLMPPKAGAAAFAKATISSTSVVAMHSGKAFTPANSLNSSALPSITGIAASGPMSPSPSTAVPSESTATVLPFTVSDHARSGDSWIATHTRATPGVYAIDRSSRVLTGTDALTSIFPPWCISNVRSRTRSTVTPPIPRTASTTRSLCATSTQATVMSRTLVPRSTRTRSIAPRIAPVSPIAVATWPNAPGRCGRCVRSTTL